MPHLVCLKLSWRTNKSELNWMKVCRGNSRTLKNTRTQLKGFLLTGLIIANNTSKTCQQCLFILCCLIFSESPSDRLLCHASRAEYCCLPESIWFIYPAFVHLPLLFKPQCCHTWALRPDGAPRAGASHVLDLYHMGANLIARSHETCPAKPGLYESISDL